MAKSEVITSIGTREWARSKLRAIGIRCHDHCVSGKDSLSTKKIFEKSAAFHLKVMGLKQAKKTAPRGGKKPSNKTDRAIRVQYGALPYRFTETNSLEVLLVTTRQTRHQDSSYVHEK